MNLWKVERGWSDAELARRSDVPYENIAKYGRGEVQNPRGNAIGKIAYAFSRTEQELLFGVAQEAKVPNYGILNSLNGTKRLARVSLTNLSQHKAGHDILHVWPGDMSVVADESLSATCFAVQMEDGSMLPDIKPGEILICDPEADLEPGCFVVAIIHGQPKAVIRKYRLYKPRGSSATKIEQKPLNDDFPTEVIETQSAGHVIARALFATRKL